MIAGSHAGQRGFPLRSEARAVNAGPFPGTGGYSLLSIVIY